MSGGVWSESEKPPPVPRIARTRKAGGASRVLRACAKRAPKPENLDGSAFDGSAKGAEFFVDAFVSAVDLTNIIDRGSALGAECSDEERHAGTDVGGFEARAEEFALSCDDDAVRVTEDNLCAHSDEGIDEEHATFKHFFEEDDVSFALRGDGDGDAHEVGGVTGPWRVIDSGDGVVEVEFDAHVLVGGDEDGGAVGDDADAEFFKDHADFAHIREADVFDADFGVRRGSESNVGADFEVIGADGVFGAVESASAVDRQRVGADALDVCAHGGEHSAETFDVGFAGDISQDGFAAREDARHDGVFGGGDGGFVEEDVIGHEVFCFEVVGFADVDLCAESLEGEEVGIEPSSSDDVAAGRWEADFAFSCEHGAGKEDRRAHLFAEFGAELIFIDMFAAEAHGVAFFVEETSFPAEVADDLHHDLDVFDAWDIVEDDFLGGEEARCQRGQDFVLVAARDKGSAELMPAFNNELFHNSIRGKR